jgi:hypothetical protein|nr:MAG TPA: hypothetical protein [Caudoviricetes sp.]
MMYVVAVVKNEADEAVAYRILDIEKRACKAVSKEAVLRASMQNPKAFMNVTAEGKELVGTNGSLSRYAVVSMKNELVSKSAPVVVLARLGNEGFVLSDYAGNMTKIKSDEAVGYATKFGIANGKIVERDGKKLISAISGEYPLIEKKKVETAAKAKFIAVNDDDSVATLVQKVKDYIAHPDEKLIGKLGDEKSDKLFTKLIVDLGIPAAANEPAKALPLLKEFSTKYFEPLKMICSKDKIIYHSKGLKELYKDLKGGATDLLDRAIRELAEERVDIRETL